MKFFLMILYTLSFQTVAMDCIFAENFSSEKVITTELSSEKKLIKTDWGGFSIKGSASHFNFKLKENFQDDSKQFYLYELNCKKQECSGSRTLNSVSRKESKEIVPKYAQDGVSYFIGDRKVFKLIHGQKLQLQFLKYQLNEKNIGGTLTCE